MSSRYRVALTAVAVAVAVSAAGCGVPRGEVTTIDAQDLPATLRQSTTTTTASPSAEPAADGGGVAVFWIRDKTLMPETITFESAPDVERVISLLERGPSTTGSSPDVRSAVSQSSVIRDVALEDATAVIELSGDFAEVAGSDQVLALGQIVATATSVPGVVDVQFRRSGESLDVPVPDGSLVQRPVRRSDYASLLSEVPSNR